MPVMKPYNGQKARVGKKYIRLAIEVIGYYGCSKKQILII